MKTMSKKLGAIVLALALCMSLCCTALAASSTDTTGSITITNAAEKEEYSIYQMFELTYANDKSSYSYKVVDDWKDFFTDGTGATYITLDENGYISSSTLTDANASEFASAALAYAKDNSISAADTIKVEEGNTGVTKNSDGTYTIKFSELSLGYYLVDTSLGALCFLNSTDPDVTINEKNAVPDVEKQVKDDTHEEDWTTKDTADIGDVLDYEITISNLKGIDRLELHDSMTAGLELEDDSIVIHYIDGSNDETLTEDEDYTVEINSETHGFDVFFTESFLLSHNSSDTAVIEVDYKADVTEDATPTNENEVYIDFGTYSTSRHVTTETDVFGFGITKVDNNENVLTSATFTLTETGDSSPLQFVEKSAGNYVVYDGNEEEASSATSNIVAGDVTIFGLEAGTYTLTETAAPDGYNKLTYDITVTIDEDGNVTFKNGTTGETIDGTTSGSVTVVRVVNNSGTELPGTGGIGTTIFYVIGGVLVVGAVVVLITRRRMSSEG